MIRVKLMIGIGVKVLVDHHAPYFGLMLVRLSLDDSSIQRCEDVHNLDYE